MRVTREKVPGPWEAGPGLQNLQRLCKIGQVSTGNQWHLLGVSKGSGERRNEKREGRGRKKGKQVGKEGEKKDKKKAKR